MKVQRIPELASIHVRSVPRHHIAVLEDPTTVWFIRSGTAGVFYSRVENGLPVGRRRFLFHARPGDAVFSIGRNNHATTHRLVVVPKDEVSIVEIPLARIDMALSAEETTINEAVEGWVNNITAFMTRGFAPGAADTGRVGTSAFSATT